MFNIGMIKHTTFKKGGRIMREHNFHLYVTPEEREGKHYCAHCKTWFDEYAVHAVEEDRGEFWGMPCTETMYYQYCPNCGTDVEEGDIWDDKDIIEEEDDEQDS